MSNLIDRLKQEILILDGAMGTELQKRKLEIGDCPEELNLSKPKVLKEIHSDYIKAGSDIIQTNTFGANKLKLAEYGLSDKVIEINKTAAELAQRAVKTTAQKEVFVSSSIGPTGKLLEPLGELSFKEAYNIFSQQAKALEAGGVDIINIETMTDLKEARAALIAVKDSTSLPVIINLTYEDNLKTMTGTDPETAVTVFESLGADVIGANCSLGPDKLVEAMEIMGQHTESFLCVQPNAGLPQLDENGNTIFPMEAEIMADYIPKFIQAGVNIIGGCCGSGPDYIKLASKKANEFKPQIRSVKPNPKLASRTTTVVVSDEYPTRIIGERINPSARDGLADQLANNNLEIVATEASKQVQAGADIIDVNVGASKINQIKAMKAAVNTVQNTVDVPLSIDTANAEVLETALQTIVGKPLINSVTGEEEKLTTVLPLARKYGAAVLGLTLDENGIPDTAEGRLEIAKKIVRQAREFGIKKEDVFIDTLVLAASAEQELVQETIKALKLIKEELGVATVLGVSNISYGLPQRNNINSAYLAMAIQAGLNAPILDPTIEEIKSTLLASDLLTNRDKNAKRYLAAYGGQNKEEQNTDKKEGPTDPLEKINQQIIKGNKENIIPQVETALEKYKPIEIINKALIPGIKTVGEKYDEGVYFLPQLMMAAEAMQEAFKKLKPLIESEGENQLTAKVLLATVKGDIHDIGKNIVKIMLQNNGFEVVDLGKDVGPDKIINRVQNEEVDIVGLSTLMTTTLPRMEEITTQLKQIKPDIKILVGGAVVTENYAQKIGAHGYAPDAVKAVEKVEELLTK